MEGRGGVGGGNYAPTRCKAAKALAADILPILSNRTPLVSLYPPCAVRDRKTAPIPPHLADGDNRPAFTLPGVSDTFKAAVTRRSYTHSSGAV